MCYLGLEKAEEPEIKLPSFIRSQNKQEISRKTSTSASLTMLTYMQVRKQQLELAMEKQTGSKQEKEYMKAVYCHSAYLTSMQSTS